MAILPERKSNVFDIKEKDIYQAAGLLKPGQGTTPIASIETFVGNPLSKTLFFTIKPTKDNSIFTKTSLFILKEEGTSDELTGVDENEMPCTFKKHK